MRKIKDIMSDQHGVEALLRIEKVIVSTGSNGNNYMIVHLVDKTGRIEARKWLINERDKEEIKPNYFIHLTNAVANEYRGSLQLKINDYQVINEAGLAKFGYDLTDFFISAPVNIEKEYKNLVAILKEMENKTYREITLDLLKKYEKEFLIYPAAISIHHNVTGGLFWHSYTLVKNALAIKPNYKYADIDWELVICGSVLHDIGKAIELKDNTGTDYSLEGKLLGHISIGNTEINKAAEKKKLLYLDDGSINPSVTLLQHMVLASHGKNEYGSPMEPLIIEAVILSMFDNLDARIYRTNDELMKIDEDHWTPRIMSEDGKFFYNHFKKK